MRAGLRSLGLALAFGFLAAGAQAKPNANKAPARRDAHHGHKSAAVPDADYAHAPSYRYANMAADACKAELGRRKVSFLAVDEAPGVLAPVRIPDGVGGVRYHTELPAAAQKTSPWEVFDCRLVLALADFSAILRAHGVTEAVTFSGWRPPGKRWPKGKLAERHPGGLAIDVKALHKDTAHKAPAHRDPLDDEDDGWLVIAADYGGRIGAQSCGPAADAPAPATDKAIELRQIFCAAAEQRIFTSMLTPNYNRAHYNHFHLEVTPKVKWRLVR